MSSESHQFTDIDRHIETIVKQIEKYKSSDDDRSISMENLFLEAVREAKRLIIGKDDIQALSEAVRNIFEIHLIIEYLLINEEGVKLWIGQLQNDALEIHEGMIKLFSKGGFNAEALQASKMRVMNSGELHGVEPSKPFRIKNIAVELGWAEEYDAMYKLCSKIVHPSAIKVNLKGIFEQNDDYKNTLIYVGAHHIRLIAQRSIEEREKQT